MLFSPETVQSVPPNRENPQTIESIIAIFSQVLAKTPRHTDAQIASIRTELRSPIITNVAGQLHLEATSSKLHFNSLYVTLSNIMRALVREIQRHPTFFTTQQLSSPRVLPYPVLDADNTIIERSDIASNTAYQLAATINAMQIPNLSAQAKVAQVGWAVVVTLK
jgi:hypothetical protein